MTVRIRFKPAALATIVEARYRRPDLSLVYRHGRLEPVSTFALVDAIEKRLGIRRDRPILVCADTLVLTFEGEAQELTGVDAYTNWEQWKPVSDLKAPSVAAVGRVCLAEKCDDDRMSLAVVPEYVYSREEGLLRVRLALPRRGARYCRVSGHLVVGVSGDMLSELWIEKLVVI